MPKGNLFAGQGFIENPPTQPTHIMRLQDFQSMISSALFNGIAETTLFSGKNVSGATNGRVITVDPANGNPINFVPTQADPSIIGIKSSNKYFLKGSLIKAYGSGLQTGRSYFIASDGSLSTTFPTADGTWVIRAGVALNQTDLLVTLDIMYQN